MLKRLSVLVLFALTACGPSKEGDSCGTENSGTCEDSTTVLLCEAGSLQAYKCRGTSGCVSGSSGSVVCDFSGSVAGEACPNLNESKALCDSHNANSALLCTNGVWTAQTCNACAVQNGNVVCSK